MKAFIALGNSDLSDQPEGELYEFGDGLGAILWLSLDIRVHCSGPDWLRDLAKVAAQLADALEARQEDYQAAQAAAQQLPAGVSE